MGLIPESIIAQVIDRTDIVALIHAYTPLKKAGRNFKALCPFHHEKSPSFVVNPDKQIFHCFGCGVGGNVVGFLMRQERLEFPQAVRQLADKAGIIIPEEDHPQANHLRGIRDAVFEANRLAAQFFHQELLTSKSPEAAQARQYLKTRGVSLETVKTFQIGFAPNRWDALLTMLKGKGYDDAFLVRAGLAIAREKESGCYDRFRNRVCFPIFDIQSRCVAFGARSLREGDGAKYINSPETPVYTKGQQLFGLNMTKTAIGTLDRVIVVEGYMDMIIPYVAGVSNIVAALGTALTVEQIRLIRRFTPHITMLFDTDPAGQAAMIRSLDVLAEEGVHVHVATLEAGEDPDSFIRQYGLEKFNDRLKNAQSLFDYKFDWLAKQHDANQPEGKSQIKQAMTATIDRIKDGVVKYELEKKLADKLNVPLDVIRQRVLAKGGVKAGGQDDVRPASPLLLSKTEEMLLTLLLTDADCVNQAKGIISVDDFEHPASRAVVSVLFNISAGGSWSIKELVNRLTDEASVVLVTRLVSTDDQQLGDKVQLFKDCLRKLGEQRYQKIRKHLQGQLRLAQQSRNTAQQDEILRQIDQCDKKIKGGL